MKAKNIIFCLTTLFASHAFAENWILIGLTPDLDMTAYVDKDSIKKSGKYMLASDKLVLPKFDATMYSVLLYNCKDRETQLQSVFIKGGNGAIQDLGKPNPLSWAYKPASDDLPSKTFDYVCKK